MSKFLRPSRVSVAAAALALATLGNTQCGPADSDGGPVPVLFVHGFLGEFSDSFTAMRAWLTDNGWADVELREMHMGNSMNCIFFSAVDVARAAERLMSDTGASRIDIVGHSLGGVVARFYIKYLGGADKIRNYVSIASPQHGTSVDEINPFMCVTTELAVGSTFLNTLNDGDETPGDGILYTSIRGVEDYWVQPQESAILAGATNVATTMDHVQLLLLEPSFELVKAALEGGGANDD
ncbi:MAG: alpha/beta fold hydrolase [Myxococcales bacterium]|nr:alpha/beta fold hydrolase [Myxococcales bacterium]